MQVQIRSLHDQHRFAEASAHAKAASQRYPDDTTLMLLHGDARLELGDYEGALAVFQAAIDARPDLRTYNRGAWLRWHFGDLEGAIELAGMAIAAGGPQLPEPTAFCYVDLAHYHLMAGALEPAGRALSAALALVPGYRVARSLQARVEVAQGEPEAAIRILDALTDAHPQVADLLLLAELLEAQGEIARAQTARERAEAMATTDPRAIAHDLARRGEQLPRALALAEAAQAARPTVEHLDTYALVLLRVGEIEAAAQASDGAVAAGRVDPRLHLTRGLIALATGDRDGAAASLAKAEALNAGLDPRLHAELKQGLTEG